MAWHILSACKHGTADDDADVFESASRRCRATGCDA